MRRNHGGTRLVVVGMVTLCGCDSFMPAPSDGEMPEAPQPAPDRSVLLLRGHQTRSIR